jgi:prevent-host-death family protein
MKVVLLGKRRMPANHVSIGQVKWNISELVNRVAFGGERIILTSRGKPKAALISIQDYELLEQLTTETRQTRWAAWQHASQALTSQILARRQGEPIAVDKLWEATRAELEERDEHVVGD